MHSPNGTIPHGTVEAAVQEIGKLAKKSQVADYLRSNRLFAFQVALGHSSKCKTEKF
jgi:hypothetical protein